MNTGGRRIVAYAGKVPDLRGATLTSAMDVRLKDDGLEISGFDYEVSSNVWNQPLTQKFDARTGKIRSFTITPDAIGDR